MGENDDVIGIMDRPEKVTHNNPLMNISYLCKVLKEKIISET
jgi:hypothetical protein